MYFLVGQNKIKALRHFRLSGEGTMPSKGAADGYSDSGRRDSNEAGKSGKSYCCGSAKGSKIHICHIRIVLSRDVKIKNTVRLEHMRC